MKILVILFILCSSEAYSQSNDSTAIYANLSRINVVEGDFSLALQNINKAIRINPFAFELYYFRGMIYFYDYKRDSSADDFAKVAELINTGPENSLNNPQILKRITDWNPASGEEDGSHSFVSKYYKFITSIHQYIVTKGKSKEESCTLIKEAKREGFEGNTDKLENFLCK
jgi:hypothetical protein